MRSRITAFGLGVVAAAAAALSFASLTDLAARCGTTAYLAWLLPLCLDAAALVSTRVWLAPDSGAAVRRAARFIAITMLVLSVAGNGVDHALVAYHFAPPWWVLVAVAAVPPAVLGAVAHLAALTAGDHARAVVEVAPVAATAERVDERPPPHGELLAGMATDAQRVRYAAQVTGHTSPRPIVAWLAGHGHEVTAEGARSALRRADLGTAA